MRKPRLLAAAAACVLVGTALAGCDSHSSPLHPVVPNGPVRSVGPGGVVATTDGTHLVTADRGNLRTADFALGSGVTTVVVHSGDIGGALYRVSTPAGAGQVPSAVLDDGHVVAQLTSSGTNGPSIVDVLLSDAVAWTIHLDGGATEATVDMKAGGLAVLDFGAGVARIDATVPKVGGTVLVRMSGGSSEFAVHAPTGVPTRVTMAGGGGSATIDGDTHSGIAGGTVYTPDGWGTANPRIDVDNTAGVSTFTLDRY